MNESRTVRTKAQLLLVPGFVRTVMDTTEPNRENTPDNFSCEVASEFTKVGRPPTQIVAASIQRQDRRVSDTVTSGNTSALTLSDKNCGRMLLHNTA